MGLRLGVEGGVQSKDRVRASCNDSMSHKKILKYVLTYVRPAPTPKPSILFTTYIYLVLFLFFFSVTASGILL